MLLFFFSHSHPLPRKLHPQHLVIPTLRTSILMHFMIWLCQKKMKQENLPFCLRKLPHLGSLIPFLPIPKAAAFRHPHLPLLWLNNLLALTHFPLLQLIIAFRHPYLSLLQLNHLPALTPFPHSSSTTCPKHSEPSCQDSPLSCSPPFDA